MLKKRTRITTVIPHLIYSKYKKMGIISKEQYEISERLAHERRHEQKKNKNLTEYEHDLISTLCDFRHKIHCGDRSWAINYEAKDYEVNCEKWENIYKKFSELENKKFKSLFLKSDTGDLFTENALCLEDWYEVMSEEEKEAYDYDHHKWYDSVAIEEAVSLVENMNSGIENFLVKVDNEFGTNYKVHGKHRNINIGLKTTARKEPIPPSPLKNRER